MYYSITFTDKGEKQIWKGNLDTFKKTFPKANILRVSKVYDKIEIE